MDDHNDNYENNDNFDENNNNDENNNDVDLMTVEVEDAQVDDYNALIIMKKYNIDNNDKEIMMMTIIRKMT